AVRVTGDELAVLVEGIGGVAAVLVQTFGIDAPRVRRRDRLRDLYLIPVDRERRILQDAAERRAQHDTEGPRLGFLVTELRVARDVGQLGLKEERERTDDRIGEQRRRMPWRVVVAARRCIDQLAAQL